MQKIGATGDGKSAVATPDGKKPKEEEEEQLILLKCYLTSNILLVLLGPVTTYSGGERERWRSWWQQASRDYKLKLCKWCKIYDTKLFRKTKEIGDKKNYKMTLIN